MFDKILLIGQTGFLGSILQQQLSGRFDVATLDRSQFDLSNNELIEKIDLTQYEGRYVIICAAITDIETCFKNKDFSYQVNVRGTKKLLQKIKQAKAVPIFFSSDYVFSYRTYPLKENDEKRPITVYGQQKLEVEEFIKSEFKKYLIFRTIKLMSKTLHVKNILMPAVKNLINSTPVKLFEDQWLNPVFAEDIALVIEKSIQTDLSGEYHLATKTLYTRAEMARKIAQHLGGDPKLIQSGYMSEVTLSEPRPNHNLLNCEKIETALNFKFTEVLEAINDLVQLVKTK